jgi:hypothetical protein
MLRKKRAKREALKDSDVKQRKMQETARIFNSFYEADEADVLAKANLSFAVRRVCDR